MRVFGIDPGSYVTGYGVVEKKGHAIVHIDNGVIRPKRNLPFSQRLHEIYKETLRLISIYNPDALALEDIFLAKNFMASVQLGHVRGAAMIAAAGCGLKLAEYHPNEVKKAVAGAGHASKTQVQKMVQALLKLPEAAAEDASDALAVAICHCNSVKIKQMIENKCVNRES
jgi:crossover junction endodeoxyribonuclease RuvC